MLIQVPVMKFLYEDTYFLFIFKVYKNNREKCQPVIDALTKCCEKPGTEDSIVCDGMRPANNPNMKS